MKIRYLFLILIIPSFSGCKNDYYSSKDFQSVLKIDSHTHISGDGGFFEDQAAKDNFILLTINVDHSDSEAVMHQHDLALASIQKHPGRVFYSAAFYFDTTGWGTDLWSKKAISHLSNNISGGAVSVKLWKNIGMTERDKTGKFIMVDDPGLKPVIDFIISKGLPITGHLGEPRNCWLPLKDMTVRGDSSYYA